MSEKKWYKISLFVGICVLINYAGKIFAQNLQLPLFLDSFGTVVAAYVLGPLCGAMVGMTVNIIYGILYSWTYIFYAVVSAIVAVTVGICARKGYLKNLFGTLSISFLTTILSVVLSVPFNYMYFDGYTNNKWGDGVINALERMGFNPIISHCAGEFYLDFLDKVITIVLLFLLIRFYKSRKKVQKNAVIGILLCLTLGASLFQGMGAAVSVHAKEKKEVQEENNYNTYLQTIYGRENGIPGGCANDIVQTNDGVLWIGTYGGLYRYNGSEFRWVDEYESVKTVNCLYTDEEGRLWVGTNDSGVSIFINESIANVVSEKEGLSSDSVRCITQSSDGEYYVGTSSELSVVTLSGGLSVKRTISEVTYAESIDADKNGNVAVVADEGKLFLIQGGKVTASYQPLDESAYVCCLFQDELLYVGTSKNQIDVYSVQGETLEYQKSITCGELSNINSLYPYEDTIFVCADNGVGYIEKKKEFQAVEMKQFNSSIDHMLVDYQGNLWFTSSRLGVLRMCKSIFRDIHYEAAEDEKIVNAVTEWQGQLYIGTDKGLKIVDTKTGAGVTNEWTELLSDARIRSFMVDRKGNLWACTTGKGAIEIEKNGQYTIYNSENGVSSDKIRTTIELKNGDILAAGDAGLTYIKGGKVLQNIGEKDGLLNPKMLCTLELEDGTILAGTDGNGIEVIKDGKVSAKYGKAEGLSSEVILRMVADEDGGGVFIVTSNSICYMESDRSIRILDNFPYFNNYDLVENKNGMLFVPGSAGIYVVDKKDLLDGKEVEYQLLNSKSGLENALTPNAWNYVDQDENLYFSTDNGVTCMNLNHYNASTRSYRMQMKSVEIDGARHSVKRGEPLYVERGAETIEIFPEIINYSVYKPYVSVYLEGYDKAPKVMQQGELSSVIYTNLPVGSYTFHLAVLDSKDQSVQVESTYQIIKKAEIYDNWWFMLYMVAVFAIAVTYLTWLVFHTQVQRTLNIQKRELELVKKQLEMGNETVLTIARTVDAKDVNTSQHSARVAEYSVMIGKELGFDEQKCSELKRAALLHDIGKIGIPDRILNKPERLTDEEYKEMKSHVVKGGEILKSFTLIDNIEEGALYHHERYDGKGYVHGLKGEEIPLNARIIGIADAFDAMTANRVYRKKLDMDFVLGELKKGRGTQFDPQLTDIMLHLIETGQIDMQRLYDNANVKEEEE